MNGQYPKSCTAFKGNQWVASGTVVQVAAKLKKVMDVGQPEMVLIFDDLDGDIIEVDLRGTIGDVLKRLEDPSTKGVSPEASTDKDPDAMRGPGRPKLGVVSREVTLLPRHWDWLNSQPGGASVALRKLVDEARHVNRGRDKVRHSQEAAYRFMSAIAGNLPGYEEAIRALFAGNRERFDDSIASWPADIREYALKLSKTALHSRKLERANDQ